MNTSWVGVPREGTDAAIGSSAARTGMIVPSTRVPSVTTTGEVGPTERSTIVRPSEPASHTYRSARAT